MTIQILSAPRERWADVAADAVLARIAARLREVGHCAVMLTGGRSAAQLYTAWARHPEFRSLTGVAFYFGDERCVPPDHSESNYGLAMRTLFASGLPAGCTVQRMEADSADQEAAADRYAAALPDYVDVLLLGVGEDGHIASLFPHSAALGETRRRVVAITGPKPPPRRLTITPPVIRQARSVFVLAAGAAKAAALAEALRTPEAVEALPARMVLGATWLLEDETNLWKKP
ncbi:MAG: 6-phosphogluconolactonase [Betaproteobacteria bacterium]|nr:6-phosphogluconolactonase [Betaproteobacteria bacterium]